MKRPILFVAGARPNFVKIAPIIASLRQRTNTPFMLVHTGQHYDHSMSGVFFEQLGIPTPEVHLQIGSSTHGAQVGAIMTAFERLLLERAEPPRGVVVVGDVNSTMATALVAVKLGIQVAHVEAGLRSFDRSMPEEINRIVTDSIANLLLVSEPSGMTNLAREGIAPERVRYVGNVMIDSVVQQLPNALRLSTVSDFGLRADTYALVTIHRPSNVDSDERLIALLVFLERLAAAMPVIFPVHPRTRKRLEQLRQQSRSNVSSLQLIEPVGYHEFLALTNSARVVVTDSGGVQEESTFLGVPCVTLRTSTERPVTISEGTNVLVGDDLELALSVALRAIRPTQRSIEGWDGHAAERVVEALTEHWG